MTTSPSREQCPSTSSNSPFIEETPETTETNQPFDESKADPELDQPDNSTTIIDDIQGELEEIDQEENQPDAYSEDDGDHSSPFLFAQESHHIPVTPRSHKPRMVILPDGDIGLNSLTPTRPRTKRSFINPFRQAPLSRDRFFNLDDDYTSSLPPLPSSSSSLQQPSSEEQEVDIADSLIECNSDDLNSDSDTATISGHSYHSIGEEDNTYDSTNEEDINTFSIPFTPIPVTPKKPRQGITSIPVTPKKPRQGIFFDPGRFERPESSSPSHPDTPGTLLSRWKYDIMMKHTSMKPPRFTEDDLRDPGESSVRSHSLTPLQFSPTRRDSILSTPTRPRESKIRYYDETTNSESHSDNGETSDNEISTNYSVSQGKKRRSGFESDDYECDPNNEMSSQEIENTSAGKTDFLSPVQNKQQKLDFESPCSFPVTPVKQKQPLPNILPEELFTPQSKRFFTITSSLTPPRAPVLSNGSVPMFHPDSFSESPSQRQRRPFSHFNKLTQSSPEE